MISESSENHETGTEFAPRFDANGLVTAIVVETGNSQLLMVAHMNNEAIALTLSTGEAHFYSRSRAEIWHKGGTSGNVLVVDEIKVDCDQDALLISVSPQGHGAACHTGRKSCFYRTVIQEGGQIALKMDDAHPLFDPAEIYHKSD